MQKASVCQSGGTYSSFTTRKMETNALTQSDELAFVRVLQCNCLGYNGYRFHFVGNNEML